MPNFFAACSTLFSSLNNPFLLYFIGIIVTALVQSSSAVTGIVIIMISGGALPVDSGIYLIIGATLGTVATTLLASIGGDINGKRAAWICFVLRFITSIIVVIVLAILGLNNISIGNLLYGLFGSFEFAAAIFLVIYNLIFMPLLIPFLKPSIKLAERFIKDKKEENAKKVIKYIDIHLLKSPNIAVMQTKKEIIHMFELSKINYINGYDRIVNQNTEKDNEIILLEDQIDYLNKAITDFLIQLSNNVSDRDSKKVGSYFHVINDIERIGDHASDICELVIDMSKEKRDYNFDHFRQMYTDVSVMLIDSISSYVNRDIELAKQIIKMDDAVDAMFEKNKEELIEYIHLDIFLLYK